MKRKIVKRERAKCDLVELASYIAQHNLDAAYRFLAAAESAFVLLAETPHIGVSRVYADSSLHGIRMWPIRDFDKHLVFYREIPDGLEIIRVLHSSRDIDRLFEME